MRLIRINFNRLLFLVFLVGSSFYLTGCATYRAHPDFKRSHEKMSRVVVLPADTDAIEVTFNAGNKPLQGAADIMKNAAGPALKEIFEKKGYVAQEIPLESEVFTQKPDLKNAYLEIKSAYEKEVQRIAKDFFSGKPFEYSVGSRANAFGDELGADVIILVHQVGVKESTGVVAQDVAQSILVGVVSMGTVVPTIGPTSVIDAEVAVIDVNLGNILWHNVWRKQNAKLDDPKSTEKILQEAFAAFPDAKNKSKTIKEKKSKLTEEKALEVAASNSTAPIPQNTNFGPKKTT